MHATLLKAALLGVLQGLTEFLPVSSTAHLLIGSRLLGFERSGRRLHGDDPARLDPRGDVALSRRRSSRVVAGLPSQPEARRFALMIVAGDACRRWSPARCSSTFVKSVLYGSFAVIALAFIVGGIVMLVVERFRPAPDVIGRRRACRSAGRSAIGVVSDAGARFPASRARAATIVGGDGDAGRSRRPRPSSRSFSRCRRWRRRSRTICSKSRHDLGVGARRSRSRSAS